MEQAVTYEEERALKEFFEKEENGAELLEEAKNKIKNGMPLGYIIGKQYFCNLELKVSKDTLIPRPDTERVVEYAAKTVKKGGVFVDLCSGSGAIALALADLRPDLCGYGVEISSAAYSISLENKEKCDKEGRVHFICADIFEENIFIGKKFDAVISNPPYIPSEDIKKYPSLSYEPLLALDGGADGLDFYRGIIQKYGSKLNSGGKFIFEIGFDQGKSICELAHDLGFDCKIRKDYSGNDRVAVLAPTV